MDDQGPTLDVRSRVIGTTARITAVGELDVGTRHLLHEHLDLALSTAELVEVDLDGIDFIESTGVACLLLLRSTAEDAGRTLSIVAASERVRGVLDLAGVADLLLD